jgi:ABC-2 type transport system ATP-binding protein
MLLSLLYPTKGKAFVLGGSSGDPKISARIGYLPEDSYLYKYLSARETLDFYGRIFGLNSKVRKSRIDTLLEMVGLTGMAHRPVGTYSKGMARRIGLAQALINDPDLLILDEPTSGMDPISTRQMKDLFMLLAKRGKTILLCSHLLADVEDVCDRIGILYGGKMQVEGEVESLLRHTDEKQIHTGSISDSAIEKIKEIILSEESECKVTTPMDRLEEFFIKIVTTAQEKNIPTSGAVNTAKIGGFLGEESKTADILDKLVSASVSAAPVSDEPADTATTTPQKDGEDENTELLEKLTQATEPEPVETKEPAGKTETIRPEPVSQEEIKQDVLEKLMGEEEKNKGATEQSMPDQSGETEDA